LTYKELYKFIFKGLSFMKKLVSINICKTKKQQVQITHYMLFWFIVMITMENIMLYLLILLVMAR